MKYLVMYFFSDIQIVVILIDPGIFYCRRRILCLRGVIIKRYRISMNQVNLPKIVLLLTVSSS